MQADQVKRRLAALESGSRSLSKLIEQDDETGALLSEEGALPGPQRYIDLARATAASGGIPELRLFKRRRLAEIAARDLAGEAPRRSRGSGRDRHGQARGP
jgi:hypothetical protein